uniref:UDP-N-acetylglucosamine kinase n=1 Tax=mine drainage metagenome TaxID=410659 RepID=E6PMI7_9ZZZZ
MTRPVLYVLAGVNGAGKSSVGGHLLQRAGLNWFNPDAFARDWVEQTGCDQLTANSMAWQEGMRRIEAALAEARNHALETTLGGNTMTATIQRAARTHDVLMWYCGLTSPELHIARVQARVAAGGHAIPEAMIRARFLRSRENLLQLMPHLAQLRVYDNSAEAAPDGTVPDPLLLLDMQAGRLRWPTAQDVEALRRTPDWAKPLLEAALQTQA